MGTMKESKSGVHLGLAAMSAIAMGLNFYFVSPAMALVKADHKCSVVWISGCANGYNCTSWTEQPCTGGGSSGSKNGAGVPFRICVSATDQTYDEHTVTCYVETCYTNSSCSGTICDSITTTTAGCN